MYRKHVKVEPARCYYWADKLGFMVWQDMPSAMMRGRPTGVRKGAAEGVAFTPEESNSFNRELDALIHDRGNSPSIVAWVPFNEGWGRHDTDAVLKHVKQLDPSRLVDGPSGWEDRGYGDLKDMHVYPGRLEDLIEKLELLVKQGLAAAIYTQTSDMEGEVNGLTTYDRKVVKFDDARLAELHRRLIGPP